MFNSVYTYKKDFDRIMQKTAKTYDDALNGKVGNLLFRVLVDSDIQIYNDMKLNTYNYADGIDTYIDDLSQAYEKSFLARAELNDDAVPSLSPVLGIGDYSAFVGGDIYFGTDTSWSKPILTELDGWKNISPLGTAPWYHRYLTICEKLLQNDKYSGIPFSKGFFSPLDLAMALRGEELYYDFTDDPDGVHGLMSYCADVTIRFAEDIYALAAKYLSGNPHVMWYLDGKINMSEDIACMISPKTWREFAKPYTQRVIDHFGQGYMHTHSRAMYMVKEICDLNHVVHLWLAADPNQPRPMDCLEQLIEDSRGVCMAIDCQSTDEIEKNRSILLKGNFSLCLPVSSMEEASSAIRKILSY